MSFYAVRFRICWAGKSLLSPEILILKFFQNRSRCQSLNFMSMHLVNGIINFTVSSILQEEKWLR